MNNPKRPTKQTILQAAQLAGLELDDARAETIAARLAAVLEELEEISEEDLAGLEPLPTFATQPEDPLG